MSTSSTGLASPPRSRRGFDAEGQHGQGQREHGEVQERLAPRAAASAVLAWA